METLEVSALEEPTLAVAEGLSMTSLFEHSVAEPTEYSCLMTDWGNLSKSYSTGLEVQSKNYFTHINFLAKTCILLYVLHCALKVKSC